MGKPIMAEPKFQKRLLILALVCIFEGMIALIALVLIPADTKNRLFLGFSLERWVLLGGILLSVGIIVLLFLLHGKSHWRDGVDRLLMSKGVFGASLLVFLAVLGFIGFYRGNYAVFLRLLPILVFAGLVSFQLAVYQLITYRSIEQFGGIVIDRLDRKNIVLAVTLLAAFPLLFSSAIKQEYPLGFAGMYSLMAGQLAAANFHLPLSVPYYGPGGVPFAYPPLGLYLMAVFLKMGVPAWSYLRFAPPLLSWLALAPLFLLAGRVSKSNLGALVATSLCAGSFYLYYQHTTSGGMVRGLAFGLGLLALYFFDRSVETFHWRDIVLAGVFWGLTALTHLAYAYYFAWCIGIWVVTQPKRKNWIGAACVGAIGFVVALPWIVTMLERYGITVFSGAFQSHGNLNFLSLIQNPATILPVLQGNLKSVFEKAWFLVLVAAGLVTLVVKKKYTLPVLFLLVTIILAEGHRFILTIAFLIAGYFVAWLYRFITSGKYITNRPLEKLVSSIILIGLFIPVYNQSFYELSRQTPLINQGMIEAAHFMKNNTPSQASYLDLYTSPSDDGEEWFPYLTQREPVISRWGSEWLGTYDLQGLESGKLSECIQTQSLICVEGWLISNHKKPGYIIMVSGLEKLSVSLESNPAWKNVYSNSRYVIWERR